MSEKNESNPKRYYVQIIREGMVVGSLAVSTETSMLWPEIIQLFGKAALAFEPVPAVETRIGIEVRPIQ